MSGEAKVTVASDAKTKHLYLLRSEEDKAAAPRLSGALVPAAGVVNAPWPLAETGKCRYSGFPQIYSNQF